jgi:hypothetical protein
VLGAFREFFDSVKLKAIPRIAGGGIHESPIWRPAYPFEHTVCRADADRIKVLEGGAHLYSDHVSRQACVIVVRVEKTDDAVEKVLVVSDVYNA